MIESSDFYNCVPAEKKSFVSTKVYVEKETPSFIMAED